MKKGAEKSAITRRTLIKGGLCALAVTRSSIESALGFASEPIRRWTACETARDNEHRMSPIDVPLSTAAPPTIRVGADKVGPAMIGFGGALTESAAHVLAQLPKDKRQQVLRSYFDPKDGIGYTLARTPM